MLNHETKGQPAMKSAMSGMPALDRQVRLYNPRFSMRSGTGALKLTGGSIVHPYTAGDVLECDDCGYTFVFRKAAGKAGSCRRCKGFQVARWKP